MLGKFDSYRDSALHFLCTSDWANESFGNVQDYGVYIWRISNSVNDVQKENMEFASVIEDWFTANPECADHKALRRSLLGHFMVSENEQGLVTVKQYTLESELIRHFNQMQEHFNQWDNPGPDYLED